MTTEYRVPQERELETIDVNVNVGPQHPATHGVFRMVLTVDGEQVVDVDPVIGYMHRGAEKLSENCDYRQAIGYQDRTDYLGQFNGELCYILAVEKLAGIQPPERAEYIRIILAELNRIASHYMFMGAFGTDIGLFGTSFMYSSRGLSPVPPADAINWGLTGPMLRATGLRFDLRRAEPYSIYDRFQFDIPTGTTGDVFDRYLVRFAGIKES